MHNYEINFKEGINTHVINDEGYINSLEIKECVG